MIITECFNDTELVYRIGFSGNMVRHEYGRSRVLAKVEEKQKAVIGIIDEDPGAGQHPKMNEYEFQSRGTESVKLLKRKDNNTKRLIQICPRLEDWLCLIAKRNKLSFPEIGVPDDPEKLHGVRQWDENFRKFLIALNKTKDDEINMFKKWIKDAIE